MPTVKLVASSYSVTGSVTVTNPDRMYTDVSSTTYATLTHTTSGTTSYYCYIKGFNFSAVPDNANVSSITIRIRGYETGLSTSTSYAPRLYNNTSTITGASAASANFGTSASTITVPYTGTWATLKGYGANLGIRVTIRRSNRNTQGYLYIYGAEIEVTYTVPVYHSVTVTNSTSATVTANPTSVLEGSASVVTANTISGISVTDNGSDVTSQFVQHSGTSGDYSVETRGSYGFSINANGYYESANKGVDKTCAVCRISFNLPVSANITFQYINYAEATYDFGVFGNVDVALTTNYYPAGSSGATISETSYKKACNTSSDNTSSVQTLTYSNVSAGSHFIDIKYSKDDATAANNDTLQFKVAITYSQSVNYYTYTISNITADHAIVVTGGGGTETWETLAEGTYTLAYDSASGVWYFRISPYTTPLAADETYRVTWNGTPYIVHTFSVPPGYTYDNYGCGNDRIVNPSATDTGEPFLLFRDAASSAIINSASSGTISIKIERLVSGSPPPVIMVGTPSRSVISDESGVNQCTCTFTSDLALQAWEARATKGVTPARGVGLLVESGTTLAAGATGTVVVDWNELTNGDGEYTITVYGQSTDGVWSE